MMINCENPRQHRDFKITSKVYEIHKRINAQLAQEKFKGKQKHNVGKSRYHDPATGKMFMLTEEEAKTTVLTKGSQNQFKTSCKTNGNGRGVYAYNDLGDIKRFKQIDEIPAGWTKGNPEFSQIKANLGTILIQNEQGEQKRIAKTEAVPDGWSIGQSFIWITDGEIQRQIKKTDEILNGWKVGRSKRKVSKRIYYNIETNEEKQFVENTQPLGWKHGRSPRTKSKLTQKNIGKMYYDPNSEIQKRFLNANEVPTGWILGTNPIIVARNPGNRKK